LGATVIPFLVAASQASAQRSEDLAALAVDSPTISCLTAATLAPSVRIVACTAAIESKALTGTNLAAGHLNRGQAYRAVGDEPRALLDFEAAIRQFDAQTDSSKLDAAYFEQRAVAHHAIGDATRAISEYTSAIGLEPHDARAYANRGILLSSKQSKYQEAIADFSKALELVPSNVDVLLLRANAYLSVSQVGAAAADAQRAAELAPEDPRAVMMRGLTFARQGDFDRAFADYTEAIRLEPRYADALANRAAIFSTRGDFDNAIHDLDVALDAAPTHVMAAYNRGYAHFAKHEYDKAIADYTLAVQLDPAMGWAYANRGLSRAILGRDLKQALGDCDEALKYLPNSPEVRETRGFVLLKAGDHTAAKKEYEAALHNNPNRPLALFGRGLARVALGDSQPGKADEAAARALMPAVDREFTSYGVEASQ
jgi:tetratricopeptide (TPR) repeat protein